MDTPGRRWLRPALRIQAAAATGLMAGFCALAVAGVPFNLGVQVAVLLGGIVVTGFPHGAFDHWVAQPRLLWLGRWWWGAFGMGYLGLAGLVWLAWMAAPAVALAGFLATSVLHFGLGDAEDGLAPPGVPWAVPVLAYGALPVLLPMALHPAASAPMLAALADVSEPQMEGVLRQTAWLLPVWAGAFGWTVLAAWRKRCGVAERLATLAGFVLLPPLLAFGVYFGAGHAVRHVLRLGAWHAPYNPAAAVRWLVATMLPAGVACAAGLGALALAGTGTATDVLAGAFRIIASLTLPHMLVTAWLDGDDSEPAVPGRQ